jgi:hypothetical protein
MLWLSFSAYMALIWTKIANLFSTFQLGKCFQNYDIGPWCGTSYQKTSTLPRFEPGSSATETDEMSTALNMYSVKGLFTQSNRLCHTTQWTMLWQDYISIFLTTNDHYYWYRGKKKKGFFALAQKCLKKILKCRLIVPRYGKNIIWD